MLRVSGRRVATSCLQTMQARVRCIYGGLPNTEHGVCI